MISFEPHPTTGHPEALSLVGVLRDVEDLILVTPPDELAVAFAERLAVIAEERDVYREMVQRLTAALNSIIEAATRNAAVARLSMCLRKSA